MSYCRFSTDDFQCDLYCYYSTNDEYVIHVAKVRRIYKKPLPPEVGIEDLDAWYARRQKIMTLQESIDYDLVTIGLPYDGETFTCEDIESFKSRLTMLHNVGYKFPYANIMQDCGVN